MAMDEFSTAMRKIDEDCMERDGVPVDFNPKINFLFDHWTDNLLICGSIGDVSLAYTVTARGSEDKLKVAADMFVKLRVALWQSKHMTPEEVDQAFGISTSNKEAA